MLVKYGGSKVIVCNQCKVLGKAASALYVSVGIEQPHGNVRYPKAFSVGIPRSELENIHLCEDCVKQLAAQVLTLLESLKPRPAEPSLTVALVTLKELLPSSSEDKKGGKKQ